jgi:hypothetical protein
VTAAKDMVGQSFGRLTVVSRAPNSLHGKSRFNCICECGRSTVVAGQCLRRSHTKSCGCWRVEMPSLAFTTHGMANKCAEYRIWSHIKTRCLNPKNRAYPRYGGRGIRMCSAWRDSFAEFYKNMGQRPSTRHSIERVDNDGNYEPGNCVWALPVVQASNRSTVRLIEYQGVSGTMAWWSRSTGIPYMKLRRRLVDGWPIYRALEDARLHPGG